jgi:AcrR family transcriptional regulator
MPASRGSHTRERLLDAAETIAADTGLAGLSHRTIARHAGLHTGLVHYHFGTVDHLIEQVLARRATRLSHDQSTALSTLRSRDAWTVGDVVDALWQPFSGIGETLETGWRNYLCLVARLAADERAERLLVPQFAEVTRVARAALRKALPQASDESLSAGLRYVRALFEYEALERCRTASAPEQRAKLDRRLRVFATAGLRALCSEAPLAQTASIEAIG